MSRSVSILISTRNRADSLRATLASLRDLSIPEDLRVELLVVDNGSEDETATVVSDFSAPSLSTRLLHEPWPNKSRALNRALRAATGEVLLFTDDDVRPPRTWVQDMAAPILAGRAAAVAGGVRLAEALRRPWMTTVHTLALAETDSLDASAPRLVGANMALHRSVFGRIPGFDPRLGPGRGAAGTHEETLVGLQMGTAGLRIVSAFDVAVEHHPSPDRITRGGFAASMDKLGRSDAYVDYHWRHASASRVRSAAATVYWSARIAARRLLHPTVSDRDEGMDPSEMQWHRFRAYHRQLLTYLGTTRTYDRYGLRPRPSASPGAPDDSRNGSLRREPPRVPA